MELEPFAPQEIMLPNVPAHQDCSLVIPMAKDVNKSTALRMMTVPMTSIVTGCPILAWMSAKLAFVVMKLFAQWKITATGAPVLLDSNLTHRLKLNAPN